MITFLVVMLAIHAAGLVHSIVTASKTGLAGLIATALQTLIVTWAACLLRVYY